jgi:murein L,D-transpeptidase YcbB/YkuD
LAEANEEPALRGPQKFHSRREALRLVAGAAALAPLGALGQERKAATLNPTLDWNQGFDSASRTITMPRSRFATLTGQTVQSLEKAIQDYQGIVARGGWKQVPGETRLRLATRQQSVVSLRQRLAVTGDLDPAAGVNDIFDSYVEAGVRRFQARHGLSTDGIVRDATAAALNVTAELRLKQLETNLVRVRTMSGHLGERYAVVNIPAAHLEAVQGGEAVLRHTTIVGKPDRPSPVLQAKIVEVNFNPFWTVPASIVKKDLIPKMQAEPDYLANNKIHIFNQRGQELPPNFVNWQSDEAEKYLFRQEPGEHNSMGSLRINMPNPHSVYMHDTPAKNLFGDDFRFHSSGCVRVQNVREFVVWLLRDTPNWGRAQIEGVVKSGERTDAKLVKPVPVYWVYITAWANPDGIVQFRDDVYSLDGLTPVAFR